MDKSKKELLFCLDLWKTQGHCGFGEKTKCTECAAPYLLFKMITGEVFDGERLTLEDWEKKITKI
jgi:hypothetical protein